MWAPAKGRANVIMFVGLQGSGKTTTCTKVRSKCAALSLHTCNQLLSFYGLQLYMYMYKKTVKFSNLSTNKKSIKTPYYSPYYMYIAYYYGLTFASKRVLLGAHCTRQLLAINIRRADAMATCLSEVEQSSICVGTSTRNGFRISINTLEWSAASMMVFFSHEVAVVLSGPGGGAACPSWNHDLSSSCWGVAHSTWHIVVVPACKGWCVVYLIFSSIHKGPVTNDTISITQVLWIFW